MGFVDNASLILSQTAATTLSQGRFTGFDGNYCGAGKKSKGVTRYAVASGGQASLVAGGIALVETAGTFDAGDPIASDAEGKAVKASNLALVAGSVTVLSSAAQGTFSGGVLPQVVNAYADEASTASGKFVKVEMV